MNTMIKIAKCQNFESSLPNKDKEEYQFSKEAHVAKPDEFVKFLEEALAIREASPHYMRGAPMVFTKIPKFIQENNSNISGCN